MMNPILSPTWRASIIYFFALIFFILLAITCYEKIRRRCLGYARRSNTRRQHPDENDINAPPSQLRSIGLASAVINSLPAIQFQGDFRKHDDRGKTDCAVCLGEFVVGEWMRLLPNCAHVFHASCIDTWFVSHSTCPLCRTNVLYESWEGKDTWQGVSNSGMMQNQAIAHVVEIESDESISSEVGGPETGIMMENGSDTRITIENGTGESSGNATDVQVMSVSPEHTYK